MTGSNNTAHGTSAQQNTVSGSNNVAAGLLALQVNTTGNNNIAIGSGTGNGDTYGGGRNNIFIGSLGVNGDTGITRIGTSQVDAFIGGVSGANASGGAAVYVTATGQLSSGRSRSRSPI
jgi:hypothetical protein